jgi:hypothetical protein
MCIPRIVVSQQLCPQAMNGSVKLFPRQVLYAIRVISKELKQIVVPRNCAIIIIIIIVVIIVIFLSTEIKELGVEKIKPVYCPFSGHYKFVYKVNATEGTTTNPKGINGQPMRCEDSVSRLDSCPSGSAINLRFRGCSSPDTNGSCLKIPIEPFAFLQKYCFCGEGSL